MKSPNRAGPTAQPFSTFSTIARRSWCPRAFTGERGGGWSGSGEILLPLDETALRTTIREWREEDLQSVAVCLLFSFLKPEHEERARAIISEEIPGCAVSL